MRARAVLLLVLCSLLAAGCASPSLAQVTALPTETGTPPASPTDTPAPGGTETPAVTDTPSTLPASETPTETAAVTPTGQLAQSPCAGHNPATPPAPTATQTPALDLTPEPDFTALPPNPGPTRTPDLPPPPYQTPVPLPTSYGQSPKHLRITLHMQGCSLTVEAVAMDFGLARSDTGDPDQFFVYLHGLSGQLLGEIRTWDPRAQAVYQNTAGDLVTDPFSIQEAVTVDLILPFNDQLASIVMADPWSYVYARVDVVSTIAAFCQANPQDPECAAWLSNLAPATPTP